MSHSLTVSLCTVSEISPELFSSMSISYLFVRIRRSYVPQPMGLSYFCHVRSCLRWCTMAGKRNKIPLKTALQMIFEDAGNTEDRYLSSLELISSLCVDISNIATPAMAFMSLGDIGLCGSDLFHYHVRFSAI